MASRLVLLLAAFACVALAVDHSKFKKCNDLSFCRTHRRTPMQHQYHLEQVTQEPGVIKGQLAGNGPPLSFEVRFYTNGLARMRVLEANPLHVRWEVGWWRRVKT